jgi:hypothetical protein
LCGGRGGEREKRIEAVRSVLTVDPVRPVRAIDTVLPIDPICPICPIRTWLAALTSGPGESVAYARRQVDFAWSECSVTVVIVAELESHTPGCAAPFPWAEQPLGDDHGEPGGAVADDDHAALLVDVEHAVVIPVRAAEDPVAHATRARALWSILDDHKRARTLTHHTLRGRLVPAEDSVAIQVEPELDTRSACPAHRTRLNRAHTEHDLRRGFSVAHGQSIVDLARTEKAVAIVVETDSEHLTAGRTCLRSRIGHDKGGRISGRPWHTIGAIADRRAPDDLHTDEPPIAIQVITGDEGAPASGALDDQSWSNAEQCPHGARADQAFTGELRTHETSVAVDIDPDPQADPGATRTSGRVGLEDRTRHAELERVDLAERDDDRLVIEPELSVAIEVVSELVHEAAEHTLF